MSDPISGGALFAIPYHWNTGNPEKNTLLLDHLCDHPMWFASSLSREEIRLNAMWMATNPEMHKFEVWNGGRLAGMLFLSRIIAPVDALFHFTFFGAPASGVTLFGARKLIQNFLGFAFDRYGLRRISMEVPEHYPKLIRFTRQKLGFRYEGEQNCDRFNRLQPHLRDQGESMRAAIALHGSRKEGAHWNGKDWTDIILLRLSRQEYEARASLGIEPKAEPEISQGVSDEPRRKTSSVFAGTST